MGLREVAFGLGLMAGTGAVPGEALAQDCGQLASEARSLSGDVEKRGHNSMAGQSLSEKYRRILEIQKVCPEDVELSYHLSGVEIAMQYGDYDLARRGYEIIAASDDATPEQKDFANRELRRLGELHEVRFKISDASKECIKAVENDEIDFFRALALAPTNRLAFLNTTYKRNEDKSFVTASLFSNEPIVFCEGTDAEQKFIINETGKRVPWSSSSIATVESGQVLIQAEAVDQAMDASVRTFLKPAFDQGNWEEVESQYAALKSQSEKSDLEISIEDHLYLAKARIARGSYPEAAETLRGAIDLGSDEATVLLEAIESLRTVKLVVEGVSEQCIDNIKNGGAVRTQGVDPIFLVRANTALSDVAVGSFPTVIIVQLPDLGTYSYCSATESYVSFTRVDQVVLFEKSPQYLSLRLNELISGDIEKLRLAYEELIELADRAEFALSADLYLKVAAAFYAGDETAYSKMVLARGLEQHPGNQQLLELQKRINNGDDLTGYNFLNKPKDTVRLTEPESDKPTLSSSLLGEFSAFVGAGVQVEDVNLPYSVGTYPTATLGALYRYGEGRVQAQASLAASLRFIDPNSSVAFNDARLSLGSRLLLNPSFDLSFSVTASRFNSPIPSDYYNAWRYGPAVGLEWQRWEDWSLWTQFNYDLPFRFNYLPQQASAALGASHQF